MNVQLRLASGGLRVVTACPSGTLTRCALLSSGLSVRRCHARSLTHQARTQHQTYAVMQTRKQSWARWAKGSSSKSASESNLASWERTPVAAACEPSADGASAGAPEAVDGGAKPAAAQGEELAKVAVAQQRHRRAGSRSAWWPLGRVRPEDLLLVAECAQCSAFAVCAASLTQRFWPVRRAMALLIPTAWWLADVGGRCCKRFQRARNRFAQVSVNPCPTCVPGLTGFRLSQGFGALCRAQGTARRPQIATRCPPVASLSSGARRMARQSARPDL